MFKLLTTGTLSFIGIALLLSCRQKLPTAKGSSLLWEITGNGLSTPSYFFGTMHLMCAEDAVLSPNLQLVLKKVDQVYFEVDLDNAGELLSGVFDINMKNSQRLSDLLTGEEYERVRNFYQKYQPQIPFGMIERQHPLMISSGLYELLLPCEQKNGMELRLVDAAFKLKKETKGLETIQFQAAIFDSISYEQQAKELVKTIDSIGAFRKTMMKMVDLYRRQDVEQLYQVTTEEDSSMSPHLDLLLYSRNRNWVAQFDTIANRQSTLFAVGAGHLGGPQGVLELLRKRNYNLRPIEN